MKRLIAMMLVAACGGSADLDRPVADQKLTTTGAAGFTSWNIDPGNPDSVQFHHWCSYKCIPTTTTITFTGCGPQLSTTGVPMGGGVNRISYAGDQQICYQSANPPFSTVGCISFASCTISGASFSSVVFKTDTYDDVSKLFTAYYLSTQVGQVTVR